MDNTQRRTELATARTHAVRFARLAEERFAQVAQDRDEYVNIAIMWATVANALKVGSDVADAA